MGGLSTAECQDEVRRLCGFLLLVDTADLSWGAVWRYVVSGSRK